MNTNLFDKVFEDLVIIILRKKKLVCDRLSKRLCFRFENHSVPSTADAHRVNKVRERIKPNVTVFNILF